MSKPTVIQIEARGNEGDSSSRARVLIANQPWVRRSAGCEAAAKAAAAKFFEVPEAKIRLTAPFAGIYSACVLHCSPHIKEWKYRRSPVAILPDIILIEEADDIASPIAMVNDGSEPRHKLRGSAMASLVCAAPAYHIAVSKLMSSAEFGWIDKSILLELRQIHSCVEAKFSEIPQPSTGGES